MPRQRKSAAAQVVAEDIPEREPRYAISIKAYEANNRDFAFTVRSRRCAYCMDCENRPQEEAPQLRDASEYMKQIATRCASKPDYLPPATPLAEAIFKLLLANNNRPMTLGDIQNGLASAWASVIYVKNLDDHHIVRLLEGQNTYFISRV